MPSYLNDLSYFSLDGYKSYINVILIRTESTKQYMRNVYITGLPCLQYTNMMHTYGDIVKRQSSQFTVLPLFFNTPSC